ncbi:MAG: winged helix-turn-helix transcriptional regulator [Nonomuraea sp.]|nr:winged helix-turn-helix transcriptional regulator [Nonomuraea sp.]
MLTLTFSAHDLGSIRFAFSPLREAVYSFRALLRPAGRALHLPWLKRVSVSGLDLGPLVDLQADPTGYIPDFLTPSPSTPLPDLEVELATLAATPPEVVRANLDTMAGPVPRDLYADPRAGMERLAAGVRAYWEVALAPHWPRMRGLLEGDVLFRSRQLAARGPEGLFEGMHAALRWRDMRLELAERPAAYSRDLGGEGLLLVPSVFVWPRVSYKTEAPSQPVIAYPARGLATLWETGEAATPDALAAVVGRSRALLLAQLEAPASTTELARRTGLAAGTVSEQLGLLKAAGFVSARRVGRSVLYARTRRAEAMLG